VGEQSIPAPPGFWWERRDAETYVLRDETGNTGWVLRGAVYNSKWMATFDGHPLKSRVTFRSGRSHRRVRRFGSFVTAARAVVDHLTERSTQQAGKDGRA